MSKDELTARERIAAHDLCREADELSEKVPWAAWVLRPLARLIRHIDEEIHRPDRLDY